VVLYKLRIYECNLQATDGRQILYKYYVSTWVGGIGFIGIFSQEIRLYCILILINVSDFTTHFGRNQFGIYFEQINLSFNASQ
jgi:hypothetical protein